MPPAAAATASTAHRQAVAQEQPPLAAPTPTAADDDAPPAAPLPLGGDEFPDQVLALVCSHLGPRELGRLACVARHFTEPTLTEPGGGGGGGAGGAQLLSPIEEGARLRLAAGGSGGAAVRLAGETWVRALWRVQCPLKFTSRGPEVVLSEEGALRLRAEERLRCAVLGRGARLIYE